MKDYLILFTFLFFILLIIAGIIFIIKKVLPKGKKTEIKINETKIENNPGGKNGQDDKNIIDDIADKYGIKSEDK